MQSSLVQFAFFSLALALGAGAEEALPKILGVGFPILLVAVQLFSVRQLPLAATLFALAAGSVEDAVSGLPMMTSASFFLMTSVLMRRFEISQSLVYLVYPAYQVWLSIWLGGIGAAVCWRVLLALPIGLLTVNVAVPVLALAMRKAAVGEKS